MNIRVMPSVAKGRAFAPASKSMAHRLIICASLSKGESVISGISYSQDILATIDCMTALGANISKKGDTLYINGTYLFPRTVSETLNCRECGSTLRFMVPICWLSGGDIFLTGSNRLMQRPLDIYSDIAKEKALTFEKEDCKIKTRGVLTGGVYQFPGNISSQFVSGLLFALPLCSTDSQIRLIPPIESRPYIDMTLFALEKFGIKVDFNDDGVFTIKGNQEYKPCNMAVEGDHSNAAFLKALDVIGGSVEVDGLLPHSKQGDKICGDYFEKMKKGFCTLDLKDCPDLGPVMFAVASALNGAKFISTDRLRIKESDRVCAMVSELEKMNVRAEIGKDEVTIYKSALKAPEIPLCGHNDHRIVMALTVLMSLTGGKLEGAEAINKSYPDFFDVIKKLGIEVETDGMDM